MAERVVLVLNQTVPQIQEIQAGDTYGLPASVNITGNITLTGTVDGRDVAADGAVLDTALQPGDLASQGEAEAGADNTKWMSPLRVAQAIAVLSSGIQNKLDAVTAPVGTNDNTEGYSVGSFWIDVTNDEAYRCVDATTNLAVWVKTTLQTSDLAAVALSGSAEDLTEGASKKLLTVAERTQLTNLRKVTTGIAAFAGGGQASATQLTTEFNVVATCATLGDSTKLPAAVAELVVTVWNQGAANMALFPASGDNIDAAGVDASVTVNAGSKITLVAIDGTNWLSR